MEGLGIVLLSLPFFLVYLIWGTIEDNRNSKSYKAWEEEEKKKQIDP
jgi:hypothetical protein